MKRWSWLIACVAATWIAPLGWSNQRAQGFCEQGNKTVTTAGTVSVTKVQASYPSCVVTVYLSGTVTPATIYSDNSATPLANPFTANSFGRWFFYAANGRYDVVLSGGGLPAPWTVGDVLLADPAGFSSTVSSVTAGAGITASPSTGAVTVTNTWGAVPSGTQTQYLQVQPNTGNNTTYQFADLPMKASDYAFAVTSGAGVTSSGGTLSAGNNTLTFVFVPLGVTFEAGSNHYVYVSGGTGTAEACLITGSGGLQVIIQCANSHSGTWVVGTATGGMAEAVQMVPTTGVTSKSTVITVTGRTTAYATTTIASRKIAFIGSDVNTSTVVRAASFNTFTVLATATVTFRQMGLQADSNAPYVASIYCNGCTLEVHDVGINSGRRGVYLLDAGSVLIENLVYLNSLVDATPLAAIYATTTSAVIGNSRSNLRIFHSYIADGANAWGSKMASAIYVSDYDGVLISDNWIGLVGNGVTLEASTTHAIMNTYIRNNLVDAYSGACVAFTGNAPAGYFKSIGVTGNHCNAQGGHGSGANSVGIDIGDNGNGGNPDWVMIDSNMIISNAKNGIQVGTSTIGSLSIQVSNNQILDNNVSNSVYSGVRLEAGVTGIHINNNIIQALGDYQLFGIVAVGNLVDSEIIGNDLSHNITGPLSLGGTMTGTFAINKGLNDGVLFASIPSGLPDGTVLYVTDANQSCTAGSSAGQSCLKVAGSWTSNIPGVFNSAGSILPASRTVIGTCVIGTSCAYTFPVAFTSSTSYDCQASNRSSTARVVQVTNTSNAVVTFTTTTGTDTVGFTCTGN